MQDFPDLSHIVIFLKAVVHYFVLLMGSFLSVLLSLKVKQNRERIKKFLSRYLWEVPSKVITSVTFWILPFCAGVFFLLACYGAWAEQYASLMKTQSDLANAQIKIVELTSTNRPHFSAHIDKVILNRSAMDEISVLLVVSIINTGSPSIAGWEFLTITLPTGSQVPGIPIVFPKRIDVPDRSGQTETYFGVDALYNKTIDKPIETGGIRRGVLLYLVKNVQWGDLVIPGTKYKLEYIDVFG